MENIDLLIRNGSPGRPCVVLIHGMGMDRTIWTDPCNCRILGGLAPLTVLMREKYGDGPQSFHTIFHDLGERDYPLVAWSQRRPAGPIESVIPELKAALKVAGGLSKEGVILIGHSRGGLIARKYLAAESGPVRSLITVSTPHRGSSLARLSRYVAPLAGAAGRLMPLEKNGRSLPLKRVLDFLSSRALKELLPGSLFFQGLKDNKREGIFYAATGGSNPTLFTLSGISFPDLLEKIVPANMYPAEMKSGKGDGLVSLESSAFPWECEHYEFACNHAEKIFDAEVRKTIVNIIERQA